MTPLKIIERYADNGAFSHHSIIEVETGNVVIEDIDYMDRKSILLKAAYDLLKKCDDGIYIKNALEVSVHYDDAECDGHCLMDDIAIELGIEK